MFTVGGKEGALSLLHIVFFDKCVKIKKNKNFLVLGYTFLFSLSLSTLPVKLESFSFLGPNAKPDFVVILVTMDLDNQSCYPKLEYCIMGGGAGENLNTQETNIPLVLPMSEGYICMIRANLSLCPCPRRNCPLRPT